MLAVNASRSGPGFLVSWPSRPGAQAYAVFKARHPSPSFYEIQDSLCCPLLPSLTLPLQRPCCPVSSSAETLQVEGDLDPGVEYKFRVVAMGYPTAGSNETIGTTPTWVRAAAVPDAPGMPQLSPVSPDAGAIFDVSWTAPPFDGGDLIRGYRLWANITSINASHLVLVSNTSAGRPFDLRETAALTTHHHLPLLPSHRYELSVQALNTVGQGGALSPPLLIDAPIGARAEFEVPPFAWRRGTVGRGGLVRHRVFIPVSTALARIVVQQAHGGYSSTAAASLGARQRPFEQRRLQLYVRAGEHPPEWPSPHVVRAGRTGGQRGLSEDLSGAPNWRIGADAFGVTSRADMDTIGRHVDALADGGRFNGSANMGELSVDLYYPSSRWLHILIIAATVEEADSEYDVRVEVVRGASDAARGGPHGDDETTLKRFERLDARWRYLVDPDGPSSLTPYQLSRHAHPLSSDPTMDAFEASARLASQAGRGSSYNRL